MVSIFRKFCKGKVEDFSQIVHLLKMILIWGEVSVFGWARKFESNMFDNEYFEFCSKMNIMDFVRNSWKIKMEHCTSYSQLRSIPFWILFELLKVQNGTLNFQESITGILKNMLFNVWSLNVWSELCSILKKHFGLRLKLY